MMRFSNREIIALTQLSSSLLLCGSTPQITLTTLSLNLKDGHSHPDRLLRYIRCPRERDEERERERPRWQWRRYCVQI